MSQNKTFYGKNNILEVIIQSRAGAQWLKVECWIRDRWAAGSSLTIVTDSGTSRPLTNSAPSKLGPQ